MNKTTGLAIVLAAGAIIAIVLWLNSGEEGGDATVAQATESYTCSSCGNTFELTNKQATEMMRTSDGQGITCPSCKSSATKNDVTVFMGGLGGTPEPDAPPPAVEEEAPAAPAGTMRRID